MPKRQCQLKRRKWNQKLKRPLTAERFLLTWVLLTCGQALLSSTLVLGAESLPPESPGLTELDHSVSPRLSDSSYQQIISFTAGALNPASVSISKGSYIFNYDKKSTDTVTLGVGVATRLISVLGAFYLNANLTYARFSGIFSPTDQIFQNLDPGSGSIGLSVNLFGLDSRIIYACEWFPVRWIIPFFEGGYIYTVYNQFGSSDFDAVQGDAGNSVAAAGIRFWLNPSASVRSNDTQSYFSFPVFLSLKWNRVFPNSKSFDLASSGLLLSASFGL